MACSSSAQAAGDAVQFAVGQSAHWDGWRKHYVHNAVCMALGLFGDFSVFRGGRHYARGAGCLPFLSAQSRTVYLDYIEAWKTGGRCRQFFLQRPVAARLLGTSVDHWMESAEELIKRLGDDLEAIANKFFDGESIGRVNSIRNNLSDLHRGGRTVAVLGFAGERRVVYKPKTCT